MDGVEITTDHYNKICRICLKCDEAEIEEFKPLLYKLFRKLIEIPEKNDINLPNGICKECSLCLENISIFITKCKTNEIILETNYLVNKSIKQNNDNFINLNTEVLDDELSLLTSENDLEKLNSVVKLENLDLHKEISEFSSETLDNTNVTNENIEHFLTIDHSVKSTIMPPQPHSSIGKYKRIRRKKHHCTFCNKDVGNFARHLERSHAGELEVESFMKLKKNDPLRKEIIAKLRKEGDFNSGKTVGRRGFKVGLLPCIYCKGYYSKLSLCKHVSHCFLNDNKNSKKRNFWQSDGQTLLAGHFSPRDILLTSGILRSLTADHISLVAKKDTIICEVARRYIKCHEGKLVNSIARRYMRDLAKLLIAMRKLENDQSLSLCSILHPSKFNLIIKVLKTATKPNSNKKLFFSVSAVQQMGGLIKKAISVARSADMQQQNVHSKPSDLIALKNLIEEKWATEISEKSLKTDSISPHKVTIQTSTIARKTSTDTIKNTIISNTDSLQKKIIENKISGQRKRKITRKWSLEEKQITENYFKNHIKHRIAPKKKEVMNFIDLYPNRFANRNWETIKVFVCNQYNKISRNKEMNEKLSYLTSINSQNDILEIEEKPECIWPIKKENLEMS